MTRFKFTYKLLIFLLMAFMVFEGKTLYTYADSSLPIVAD